MKNTENAAKPMSAIVYRHVCPWRLSTRPAQTSFRSDRSSSSAFMPSWNHIDPQDGSPNRAPESNSRTQDPRSDLRLRFSRFENRWQRIAEIAVRRGIAGIPAQRRAVGRDRGGRPAGGKQRIAE